MDGRTERRRESEDGGKRGSFGFLFESCLLISFHLPFPTSANNNSACFSRSAFLGIAITFKHWKKDGRMNVRWLSGNNYTDRQVLRIIERHYCMCHLLMRSSLRNRTCVWIIHRCKQIRNTQTLIGKVLNNHGFSVYVFKHVYVYHCSLHPVPAQSDSPVLPLSWLAYAGCYLPLQLISLWAMHHGRCVCLKSFITVHLLVQATF